MKHHENLRASLIVLMCFLSMSMVNVCLAGNNSNLSNTSENSSENDYPSTGYVACVQNGKDVFLSPSKWNQLTHAARSKYEVRGMVLKTENMIFVISPQDGISPGDISNVRKDWLSKVPSVYEAIQICQNIGSVQSNLKTLKGFTPLTGRYWIHLDNKHPRSQNAEFLCFDATGEQGAAAPGTLESRGIKIRDILPLYKYPYEGFDIRSLESSPQQINLGLEIKLPDGFMYMPYTWWSLVPEEIQNNVEVTGILLNNGNPFVIDVRDIGYGDSYLIGAKKAYQYKASMPTKEQGDAIANSISSIDDAMMDVKGETMGGGVTRSYFTNDFIMSANEQQNVETYTYSYGGGNIEFLENDGKVEFISPDLGKDNNAHVRRVWLPHATQK